MLEKPISSIYEEVSLEVGKSYEEVSLIVRTMFRELNRLVLGGYVPKIKIEHLFTLTVRIKILEKKLRFLLKEMRNRRDDLEYYEACRKEFYLYWLVRREIIDTDYYRIMNRRRKAKGEFTKKDSLEQRRLILNIINNFNNGDKH